jgi:hypothetical protein
MRRTLLRSVVQACVLSTFLLFVGSVACGQVTNPFFVTPTVTGGGQMLTADVNGDGKPDLLFADGTLELGKGDGTFTPGTAWKPAANSAATQFAIADFNGDGKPDILVAGPLNVLSVLLGKGDGTFQAAVTTSIAAPATSFVVGDLNGDGKPDVLAQVGSMFLTYTGNGDGTFAASIASNAIDASVLDSFADFNGDGKLDLLVAGQGIQLGNGNGTFQSLLPFPSGVLPQSSAVGDFDGNGKLDVVASGGTATSAQIQILFGNGDGTFSAAAVQTLPVNSAASNFTAVDLNGDGKADVVNSTSSSLQVLISKGDGTFTVGKFYNAPTGGASTIVIADFNSDGKKDVAAFNTILLANGDGTLQGNEALVGPTTGFGGATGDFNGDGFPDLALVAPLADPSSFSNTSVNLNIWLNDGKGNFTLAHTYQLPLNPGEFLAGITTITVAGDINGDGKIDLVGWDTFGGTSTVSVIALLGNGDGSFGAVQETLVAGSTNIDSVGGLALGDLNGDGKQDVLLNAGQRGTNNTFFYVLMGNGDGTFGAPSSPFVGTATVGSITVGDFNNDKKFDAILPTSSGLAVLLGNGDGTFQPTTFIANTACTTTCRNFLDGDFNADGKLDLLLATPKGYQALLGKGDGTFAVVPEVAVSGGSLGLFPGSAQVADFNGDGNLDVLGFLSSSGAPPVALFFGNGDGTFGSPLSLQFLAPDDSVMLTVADFNGDGRPDIGATLSNRLVLLDNNATPNFSMTAGAGATATVAAGKTGTYSLSLGGSGGFSGTVALSCSGAPAGAVCTVTPSTVNLTGTTKATATVSVTTTAASQVLPSGESERQSPDRRIFWVLGSFLAAAIASLLGFVRVTRFRSAFSFAAACGAFVLIAASLIAGCGGSGSGSSTGPSNGSGTPPGSGVTGTPAGTYNITVTATAQSRTVTHTTTLTLVVQ